MSKKKKPSSPAPFEHVLVRHAVAEKRDDADRVFSLLHAPFEVHGSGSVRGKPSQDLEFYGRAPDRWLVAAEFAGQKWIVLYSNAASGRELFEANAGSRRLEVAWFGCRPEEEGWFIRLNRGGKPVLEFAQPIGGQAPTAFQSADFPKKKLEKLSDPADAIAALCKHYEIESPDRVVVSEGSKFQMLGQRGAPVKTGLRAYLCITGPKIVRGDLAASEKLERAIERRNPEEIRKAVEAGAALEELPESSTSPLLAALFQCDKPRGRECAELLLELGCSVNGKPGKDPPILSAVEDFVPEELSLVMLDVLLSHGADVNATGEISGKVALLPAVVDGRIETVRYLMAHGADPHRKTALGKSPLEWVQWKLEETTGFSERSLYGEVLSALTGEAFEAPVIEPLSDDLQAENLRFAQCRLAEAILASFPREMTFRESQLSRLAKHSSFQAWEEELLEAGFEPAGHALREPPFPLTLSGYTNPKLRLDAVLSAAERAGGGLRCEIEAFGIEGDVITIANYHEEEAPDFNPAFLKRHELLEATPGKLVTHARRLIAEAPAALKEIEPQSFLQRYRETTNRILAGIHGRAREVLDTPLIVRGEGRPPRYERQRYYLDFSGWDDPAFSSARLAEVFCKELDEAPDPAEVRDPFRVEQAIAAACYLTGFQHYEFAGAPASLDHLHQAVDLAVGYFERGKSGGLWSGPVHVLGDGMLLAMLAGRWDDVARISEAVKPAIASPKGRGPGEPLVQEAQFLLVLASHFRRRPVRGAAALEESIAKGRPQRPRLLLETWRAARANDQASFNKALQGLLEHIDPLPLKDESGNDFRRRLAILESVVHLAALRTGLASPPLPEQLSDLLITPDSIGGG